MLLGHHAFDKTMDEYLRDIAALAGDPQTLVFLDTNILAYLYKLHEAARNEFFLWTDTVLGAARLAVPAWAASEYLSRVTSKALDSYTPKSKEPSQAKRALEALHETASLFVDDSLLRRIAFAGDRAAYLEGFRRAIDALDQYTRAFSQQFDPGVIHQQVVDHLSGAILDSDLAALCRRASEEGSARFEHRLPPGFRDGGKDENRFGDLIIWFEILDTAAARAVAFPKVLFITNDEKSDWVYSPKMRTEVVAGVRKTVGNSNPDLKLADPRLMSEFHRRTGHTNLVVCSLPALVEGLSKVSAAQFAQLAAAIQINTEEAEPSPASPEANGSEANSDEDNLPEVAAAEVGVPLEVEAPEEREVPQNLLPAEPAIPIEPNLDYAPEALQDSQYEADAPSAINSVIRALKSLNWYTQNPAIVSIRDFRDQPFTPSAWFVLGRNIYQAAVGNSQKAMEFMATLESQLRLFPPETAQHLLAGMLFEIYFDANGQFREVAKFSYAHKPLALVVDPAYEDVRTFILYHLHDHRGQVKFLPGDQEEIIFHAVSAPIALREADPYRTPINELQSVTLDGVELLRDVTPQGAWARLLPQFRLSQQRLKAKISEDLAIPNWALVARYDPPITGEAEFIIPEGKELDPKLAL